MTIDLSPLVGAALSLCAIAITTVGSWALARMARRLGIDANSAAMADFDDGLKRAVHAAAGQAQDLIAAKGYDHVETKNAIVELAAPYMIAKFAPALRSVGLDPADPGGATTAYLTAELNRVLPTAIAPIAASPAMPLGPPLSPSPPGTTADLNRAELARLQGASP